MPSVADDVALFSAPKGKRAAMHHEENVGPKRISKKKRGRPVKDDRFMDLCAHSVLVISGMDQAAAISNLRVGTDDAWGMIERAIDQDLERCQERIDFIRHWKALPREKQVRPRY